MSGLRREVAAACWGIIVGVSLAEPPSDEPGALPENIAGAPTDDAIELLVPAVTAGTPHDQPGVKLGPKTSEGEPQVRERGEREWFGGPPMWEWTRLTGDWAGGRTWLEDHGITIESSFTIEWADAISGGIGAKWVRRNYFDLNASVDTEKLFGWQGGTFYVEVASSDTQDGGVFVPVSQLTSNIEVIDDTFQVANVWYEQKLFDDVLRLKFGKMDASLEFGYLDATAGFLNLSTLAPATAATVPWYPYSGLGGAVYVYPCEQFYIGGGAFDASYVPDQFVRDDSFDQLWVVGEMGVTWKKLGAARDGRLSFGGWWDSRELGRFDGSGTDTPWGLYALVQQRLWGPEDATENDDDRGVWLFGQWGYANQDVSAISMNFGGGMALHGTFPGRALDKTGFYFSSVHYADGFGAAHNETVFEIFYGVHLTPAVTLTPDLQYVAHPGGSATADDAVVLTLRLELSF